MSSPEGSDSPRGITCAHVECDEPAVAWASIVHDAGYALCGRHLRELKEYVEEQVRRLAGMSEMHR